MSHHHRAAGRRPAAFLAAFALLCVLEGCASGPNRNPTDPLEPWNRGVSQFNENVDAVILKPTATFYREKVPAPVRTGVSNFFGNLGDAWSAVNSLLQLKIANAAENMMRFSVNTFLGFGGLLDIASEANIDRHKEDFGQTLGRWGVPAGPYLVLPLLGPSTVRDTLALPVDWRGDLVTHVEPDSARNGLIGLRVVDVRSNLLRAGDVLEGAALDKYSFTRDAYLQRRRAEIFEGSGRTDDPNEGSDAEPEAKPPAR
ncbi:MlaA family lipoprotein [Ramlibacter humi]|uniref:VacJ family lipoprotein n=1 Tax=Ramlibacter humi TaxID=2530451 RepID=A0A4Z0BJM6_9BURK|nr:VacJ family lipoprotein [Ramlibacter humi]TFY98981.1 VacJ family lipoprotein [Ramlibacter humi]